MILQADEGTAEEDSSQDATQEQEREVGNFFGSSA